LVISIKGIEQDWLSGVDIYIYCVYIWWGIHVYLTQGLVIQPFGTPGLLLQDQFMWIIKFYWSTN